MSRTGNDLLIIATKIFLTVTNKKKPLKTWFIRRTF